MLACNETLYDQQLEAPLTATLISAFFMCKGMVSTEE